MNRQIEEEERERNAYMRMANDTIQTKQNGRSSQQQKIDNINREEKKAKEFFLSRIIFNICFFTFE